MASAITVICLLAMVSGPALLNIFAYPVSYRWSMSVSNYIVKVCAHRLFAILKCYRHFNYFGYSENMEELPEHFSVISNHQSILDIPAFMNFFRKREIRFIAKDALARHVPLISEMLRTQEHCMIPRKAKPMEAMKYIEDFGKRTVARDQIPILFPEGTRTRDGNVGKFYSAGFRKLTESTGMPVAVFALDGGWELRDIFQIFRKLKNGCYRVKLLKVYPCPTTKEEAQAVLDESRVLIQQQLDEWRKLPSTSM